MQLCRFLGTLGAALLLSPAWLSAQQVLKVPGDTATLASALAQVGEGGIIELAPGTYVPPAGGWQVNATGKSFTVRGQAGATVTLDGQSSSPIFEISSSNPGRTIVFQNLVFADGLSTTDVVAGGVTVFDAEATFIDCEFRDNDSQAPASGGGGVALFSGSTGHFFGCLWSGNRARNEGGGLKIGGSSRGFVHDSEFVANSNNVPGHRQSAAGAGIHIADASTLVISNTRFDSNEGACLGGGLYVLGGWDQPAAEVTIANSTFVDNFMASQESPCSEIGAGIHAENNVLLKIFNSRFLTNTALSGAAINTLRAEIEIDDSIFRGNLAAGVDNSDGGTISISSGDVPSDTVNRPPARITFRDSLVQGRFGAVGATAQIGGCLSSLGDVNRSYGRNGVTEMDGPAVNRTRLVIERTAFVDCDAQSSAANGTGVGGAMDLSHTDLTLTDSLIIDSDALGTGTKGWGGAIRAINESLLTISGSTFANNTAFFQSGAFHLTGSTIDVSTSQFFDNRMLTSSASRPEAITTAPAVNSIPGRSFDMTGEIRDSVFGDHGALTLRDADLADGPINAVVYNDNQIFASPAGDSTYREDLAGSMNATGLNGLVVVRNVGPPTDKGAGNTVGSAPEMAALLGVPSKILLASAAGDPAPPTEAFLAYAGHGGPLTLDGDPQAPATGLEPGASGSHTLVAGSTSAVDQIGGGVQAAATFDAVPGAISGGETADLQWSTTAGTFLGMSIDRGVEVAVPAAAGSVTVTPAATTTYTLHLWTEEGGVQRSVTVFVDEAPGGDPIFSDGFESGDTSAW